MRFAYSLGGVCCTAIPLTAAVSRSLRGKAFRSRVIKSGEDSGGGVLADWSVFLTLTFSHRGMENLTELERCRMAWESWKSFRKAMWQGFTYRGRKRKFPFHFILVMELNKSGFPHFHIILDRYIPHWVLRRAWVAAGGGPVLKIEKIINGPKAALKYICKYITKSFGGKSIKGVRRWSYSKGKLPKLEKKGLWVQGDNFDLNVQNLWKPVFIMGPDGIETIFDKGAMQNYRGKRERHYLHVSGKEYPESYRGFEDSIYSMMMGWSSTEVDCGVKKTGYTIVPHGNENL